jgi:hypothetical protein
MANYEKTKKTLTKEQIEARVRAGKMTLDEALKLMGRAGGGVRFAVAEKSGWLSIYFANRKFPVSLPIENADELLQEENLDKMRDFIEKNRPKFKTKKEEQ